MKVACYIRTNQLDDKLGGTSLRRQQKVLSKYCKMRGWKNVIVYSDKVSGLKLRRPGFNSLRREVRKGRIGAVFVAELHRLSRSEAHLAAILRELEKHRVPVFVLRQGSDA